MKEDHESGRCYACNKDDQVRWKNLYTIGSEGTWLCMSCEIMVVNFVRELSMASMKRRIKHLKDRRNGQHLLS